MKTRNLFLMLAAPLLVATPAMTQNIPGKLINEPSRLDWDGTGKEYKKTGISSADIPGGGAAARYTISRKGARPFDVTANVPIVDGIAKGDDVTIGFWARTVSADTDDKNGIIGVRVQLNSAPYSGFADKSFAVGGSWKWYESTGAATLDLPKGTAVISMQLAGAKQTVEIGQMIVVKGAKAIAEAGPAAPVVDLPPMLVGKGRLINQPDNRAWGFAGPATAHAEQADKTIFLGKSTRFTSSAAGAKPWDISTQIPLGEAIAEGDVLIIAIAAKTVSAATEDGKAVVGLRIQDNTPPDYRGLAESGIKPGPNWQMLQLKITMSEALPAEKAVLALHFAGAQQVVDVGPVYILKAN